MMTEKVKLLYKQLIDILDLKNLLEFIQEKKNVKRVGGWGKKNNFAKKYIPLHMFIADIMLWDLFSQPKLVC